LISRRRKLSDIIQTNECEAGLVYGNQEHSANFRYLINFVPTMGDMWGVIPNNGDIECVLTFHWEIEEARQRSGFYNWYGQFDPLPRVIQLLDAGRPKRLAVIGLDRLPVSSFEKLRERFGDTEFVDIGDQFSILRRYKSPTEMALLRHAVSITDRAMHGIREKLQPGMTEHSIAAELLYDFQSQGISRLAFSPLVVSGIDNPVIARETTGRQIQIGDTVMIDIGADYEGYQADLTRTFVLGRASQTQERAWQVVCEAYQAVLEITRPGIPCRQLHAKAARIMADAGYPMLHRIGHGIGLATSFEWPSLDTEPGPLEPGMTIAIEPAVYAAGTGSMKLEDSLVITEDGCEVLSGCSRDLVVEI
jgi:Xaa-Pro aminopeptidase